MAKSGSGSGRGRGWMKLNNTEPARPGVMPSDIVNSLDKINTYVNDEGPDDSSQYAKIIEAIEPIDDKDDSIVLSRKVRQVRKIWLQLCKNGNEVSDSFHCIYSKCLQDSVLASKFVTVVALPPFDTVLHDRKLVIMLAKCLQHHYDERVSFQADHPELFRNFVLMMGEFFHKAKMPSNSLDKLLKEPNLVCLEMLLTNAQEEDLGLFTILLHLNGSVYETSEPKAVTSLLAHVRELLVTEPKLTTISKAWLLLALDIANCRFGLLPKEMHKFYEEKLGEKKMNHFQNTHCSLSIEIVQPNKTFDSYKSAVSVLQVSPSEPSVSEKSNSQNSRQQTSETKPLGRPILGVGVRDQGGWEKWE